MLAGGMQAVKLAIARNSTFGFLLTLTCGVLTGASAAEPPTDGIYLPAATVQSETDAYTRYELLAPDSGKFRITYEVTATTAGARTFYNPIRKGSAASDESRARRDDRQAAALRGRQRRRRAQGSADARRRPRHRLHQGHAGSPRADEWPGPPRHRQDLRGREELLRRRQDDRVRPAARHTPQQGRAARGLRSRRPDGAFADPHRSGRPDRHQLHEAPKARRRSCSARRKARGPERRQRRRLPRSSAAGNRRSKARPRRIASSERAHQDRDIVYFLQQPESHAFALYHDYTESRPGINGYANVVRKGSTASHPSASILDTGEPLEAKEMSGAEMAASKINAGETVDPDARVVVIPFPPVQAGTVAAAADRRDLHRAGQLQARWRRAGVRPQPRPAAQRRRAAVRLVLHVQFDSRDGEPASGWARAARLLERPAGAGGRAAQGASPRRPVVVRPGGPTQRKTVRHR